MRILLLTNSYPTDIRPYRGVFFKEQADAVNGSDIQVDIISPNLYSIKDRTKAIDRKLQVFEENGKHVYIKGAVNYGSRTNFYQSQKFLSIAKKLFKRYVQDHGKPDLIHAHFGLWAGWSASIIAHEYQIPYVITEHSTEIMKGQIQPSRFKKLQAVYQNAEKVIAVGVPLAKKLESIFGLTDVKVIPNVVDTDKFALTHRPDDHVIISVGNLNKRKRFDLLIRSVSKLKNKFDDVLLVIVGDGPEKKSLIQLASELNLNNNVRFAGRLNHEELQKEFEEAQIFALCSEVETFGVVVIEAMSAGLPCVVTPSGGPEYIITENSGYICEKWDVDELAKKLDLLLSNLQSFDSQSIRQEAINRFGKEKIKSLLIELYNSALKGTN